MSVPISVCFTIQASAIPVYRNICFHAQVSESSTSSWWQSAQTTWCVHLSLFKREIILSTRLSRWLLCLFKARADGGGSDRRRMVGVCVEVREGRVGGLRPLFLFILFRLSLVFPPRRAGASGGLWQTQTLAPWQWGNPRRWCAKWLCCITGACMARTS